MDRFIGQFKFAGKTLRARNQNRESGRNQSFLFQEVQLIDMHSVPLQHLLDASKMFSSTHGKSHILWEWQLSESSCIKFLHIRHAFFYGYSHSVLRHCRELPEYPWRLADESREVVSCGLDVYDPDKGKMPAQALKVIQQGQWDCIMIAGEAVETFARFFYCNLQTPRKPTMQYMVTNYSTKQALLRDQQVRNMQKICKKYAQYANRMGRYG